MKIFSNITPQAYAQVSIGEFEGIGDFIPDGSSAESDIRVLDTIFSRVLGIFTIVAGITFIIMFITGGLNWLTAGGDKGKVDAAKSRMTNAAIGLIIVVAAYGIALIVGSVLGINILDPAGTICTFVQC